LDGQLTIRQQMLAVQPTQVCEPTRPGEGACVEVFTSYQVTSYCIRMTSHIQMPYPPRDGSDTDGVGPVSPNQREFS
jgi:hypothetical protein